MVILCKNKEKSKNILSNITIFLEKNLKLTLNSKTRIFKDIQRVNFCGYKINGRRTITILITESTTLCRWLCSNIFVRLYILRNIYSANIRY